MVKRVAVLGAGCSGLTAIKCCLDEGLEPVCFEKSVDIGGLWRFKEVPEDGRASIYNSVIINTSKEMMCYSDYQIPDEYPNYMHNSKVLQYFRSYAEHFQLLKYIRFKTAVCSIQKHPDYLTTGQWDIVTETDGKQEKHVFDAILVCTGHHSHPKLPLDSFPGIEKFKGQYFHSREYKNPEPFKNKKIIVIGIGNTAVDLVVELSAVAKQVYMSTRRGAWLVNRVCDNGFPLDVVYFTRFRAMLQTKFPAMVDTYMESKFNSRVDHDNFGLKPKHRFFSQHPTISDDLPNRIISGRVIMKTNIKCFTETDVHFEDGSVEKDIDVVIFATGYSFSFPYIDESVIKVKHNEVPLYKMVFPPHLEKPTMAFIGYIQPVGAIMPVSEIQSRWATRVFKGLAKLPSMEKMKEETVKRREDLQKRYVKSERHTIQVDYVPYMDEIATEVGCMPNWKQLFLTDPKLAWQVLFGPCTPYQYRLCGPGKWNNARKAILSQTERIIKPTKTRNTECEMTNGPFNMLFKLFGILMVFAAIYAMM